MNRYPFWVNLIVILALLVGSLYTAPNFFGDAPAVQISSSKATLKVDAAVVERAEKALASVGLNHEGLIADASGVRLRFASTEAQLKGKDALERALNPDPSNPDFTVALNLVPKSPSWLLALGARPMYLGLDLRGGVHFLLQVDQKAAVAKRLDAIAADLRSALRDKSIRHGGIQREDRSITLRFREAEAAGRARALLASTQPDLVLQERTENNETLLSASLSPVAEKQVQETAVKQNMTTLHNRINELGVAEPVLQQQGADRIVVQLPGVQDTAKAKEIIGRTASLEVRMVEAHAEPRSDAKNFDPAKLEAALAGQVPFGTELFTLRHRDGRTEPILLSKQVVLTGDRFVNAASNFDGQSHEPIVSVELDAAGARIIRDVTRESIKRRMAILLVEKNKREVLTAPTIQSELGARFQISGFQTTRETNDLAILIRAGSLAAPMDFIEERTIGPSLGAENIARGFNSTLGGFLAIAVFMVAYYMLFGVISVLALGVNLLLLVALLSLLQATLTLPGIAAIALTLGMAIDANVLINERIREELRNGVTPQAAIRAGYERAFDTILDSNVTSLIAGLALLVFGSGPVRGFAVVHCLGILTSMFSAVVMSRALVNWIYGGRRKLERLSIGQVWQPTPKT